MRFRTILSIVTLVLIAVVLVLARKDLIEAYRLLNDVNSGLLLLLIPIQIIGYIAVGNIMYLYLGAKKSLKKLSRIEMARISFELNFVNHVLPSGGVSGVSYTNWRLGKFGVSPSRATVAQVVRLSLGVVAFIVLMIIALVLIAADGTINREIAVISSGLAGLTVIGLIGVIYLFRSIGRLDFVAGVVFKVINSVVSFVTFGKITKVVKRKTIEHYLRDIHKDFTMLQNEKRALVRPFIWAVIAIMTDVAQFAVVFYALGTPINIAPLIIAYGLATLAGFFVITPGGIGAYEALMVGFLTIAGGITQSVALAGILLTRVLLLIITIAFGYAFYQNALIKYGKTGQFKKAKRLKLQAPK